MRAAPSPASEGPQAVLTVYRVDPCDSEHWAGRKGKPAVPPVKARKEHQPHRFAASRARVDANPRYCMPSCGKYVLRLFDAE